MSRVVDLSIKNPIDVTKAIELLGGEASIFYNMLGRLETISLLPTLKDLAIAFDKKDFAQIKNKAHALKGASGYVGASRVHYSCYQIQEHYTMGNYEEMLLYYPTLIESTVEFRVYSRKIIAEFKSKILLFVWILLIELQFDENGLPADVETCPVSKQFTIVKKSGKFFCLKVDG